MATRPTTADLVAWLGVPNPEPGGEESAVITEVLETALEEIESRLRDDVVPGDADEYPRRVRLAVLMQSARWYKRRASPEGIAGFGEFGPVRVAPLDPDVEQLIARDVRLDGFA